MTAIVFDCEVFRYDWLFVFKSHDPEDTERYHIYHNDAEGVKEFIKERPLLCGFNAKNYDSHILRAVCADWTNQEIKALNDWIIGGKNGWEYPGIREAKVYFDYFDLRDDMQMGLSLKAIEGHLGMDIRESTVSFDLDRPLTQEELAETIYYCKHDVDATERLLEERKTYLKNKIMIGQLCGLPPEKSLYMTNAKLTAAYLQAQKPAKPRTDERNYKYPDNLRWEFIPKEAKEFFDQLHDDSIPDEELWTKKLDITIGGCPCVLGFGGIHGAMPYYQEET